MSTVIVFFMTMPVLYNGVLVGIGTADEGLLEMARVFRFSFWRRVLAVYLPAIRAPLLSAIELAMGLGWKSGVAAEVIGLAASTIGNRLYQAKIYLQMPEMFAWTAVVVLLSWLAARVAVGACRLLLNALERGWAGGAYTAG